MTRGALDDRDARARDADDGAEEGRQPDDVARTVVALASDEISGHVTGQVVTVAGGMEGRVIEA